MVISFASSTQRNRCAADIRLTNTVLARGQPSLDFFFLRCCCNGRPRTLGLRARWVYVEDRNKAVTSNRY